MTRSTEPARGGGVVPLADRVHRGTRFEDAVNHAVARWLWARGWRTRIEPYAGYGAPGWVRVLGRTVLAPPHPTGQSSVAPGGPVVPQLLRGWRRLATVQVAGVDVEIRAGTRAHRVRSDRGGYVDAVVGADLAPGWRDVELALEAGSVRAPVLVIGPEVRSGIVSDIDDTVMVTSAPRPLLAVWNTFVVHESTRRPVPGMAELYDRLLAASPQAPVLYLSTGAWNAAPALRRFLRRYGYPDGPLLLTDWGPTRTGWFRDGADHKRSALRRLTREFPHVQWLLVGDDGQRDPELYAELAAEQPERVRAVAIRQLSSAERAVVRRAPTAGPEVAGGVRRASGVGVPVIAARNGLRLAEGLREAGVDLR